jgi:hypothetical protein
MKSTLIVLALLSLALSKRHSAKSLKSKMHKGKKQYGYIAPPSVHYAV